MPKLFETLWRLLFLVLRGAIRIWRLDRLLFILLLLGLVAAPAVWAWSPFLGALYGLFWVLLVSAALVAKEAGLQNFVADVFSPGPPEVQCSSVLLRAIEKEAGDTSSNGRVISGPTGPTGVHRFNDLSPESLSNLEKVLTKKLRGQEPAISLVTKSLRRRSVGISDCSKPLSFLLVGPTGVGKTQLAKLTAKGLGRKLEQFDIGQLGKEGRDSNAQGSGWTLFGSPQGFIGGEGKLTSAVVANPNSVILLDEIEKGSPELLDLFLAILDEGSAKDNRTNAVVDFSDCIIFFTSNLVTAIPPQVHANPSLTRDLVLDRGFFKTEMINRISHVVPMKCLETTALRSIALDLMEPLLTRVVGPTGHKIVDRAVIEAVLEMSDTKYGARDLQRVVDEIVGDPLTDAVFGRDDALSLKRVSVRMSNGRIEVEVA